MKKLSAICRYLVYLSGVMFIILAFDCFGDADMSLWEEIGCFLISIIPGVVLILLNYFLRKKELIMGIILVLASIFFMFFFQYYKNIIEHLVSILIVIVPPLVCGIVFIVSRNRYTSD